MGTQKRNCAASVTNSTFMCLWAIYIFPGSVNISSCSRIGRPSIGICISFTDTWMWKLGLRLRNSFSGNICFQFSVLCLCSVLYFSTEYHNSRQNIITLFRKYFVDTRSEARLNLFFGTHKWKIVCHVVWFCCAMPSKFLSTYFLLMRGYKHSLVHSYLFYKAVSHKHLVYILQINLKQLPFSLKRNFKMVSELLKKWKLDRRLSHPIVFIQLISSQSHTL